VGPLTHHEQLDEVERDLMELLLHDYGYNYRNAGVDWLRHKIRNRVTAEDLQTVNGLREKVFHDEACRRRLLQSLTLDANTMFHEPYFYRAFRALVVPLLRTYPFIRIWHVGCSTGEEVYSIAILLAEEGLYERCRLYATDVDEAALAHARSGIVPLQMMQAYTANYLQAGGKGAFSEYYTASHDDAIFRHSLRKNLIFARHSLQTDGAFNEFHVIICRNVMTTWSSAIRARARSLFRDSLVRLGFLCLGAGERTGEFGGDSRYDAFDAKTGIWRRMR
jgi:chemotaxis protein methyltransferase CheR